MDGGEWTVVRRHPQVGFNILRSIDFLATPAEMVLSHQERFDGTGYPRGLAGLGRHLRRHDSDRPRRDRMAPEAARDEIKQHVGTQFDPECAEAFLSLSADELAALARSQELPPV